MKPPAQPPAWWLKSAHLQTLWGKLARIQRPAETRVERWGTPDADFVDVHRLDGAPHHPRVLLLHGLEGTFRSHYVQGFFREAQRRGWSADLLVFRGCGGELNRARRFYHSGETTDLRFVVERILATTRNPALCLAGVSLGGNVLLKFLGEEGSAARERIAAAAAVSVPFDLAKSARNIDRGFSRIYQHRFMRSLKRKALEKLLTYPDHQIAQALERARTMQDFDNAFTAPVHGFKDAADYYAKSSSLHSLPHIRVKTLLLQAVDDPFLPASVLDEVRTAAAGNGALAIEFTPGGGHVGFVAGSNPFRPVYYAERRVFEFFERQTSARATPAGKASAA